MHSKANFQLPVKNSQTVERYGPARRDRPEATWPPGAVSPLRPMDPAYRSSRMLSISLHYRHLAKAGSWGRCVPSAWIGG